MTTIETFEDILAAMDRDPKLHEALRQRILDEEFRRLPAIVRELQEAVAQLARTLQDFMQATNERLARLEAGQAKLEAGQEELRGGQAKLEAGQEELRGGQAKLEAGQEELRGGQAKLEAGQEELRGGQAKLEAGQEELRGGQAKLEAGQEELRGGQAKLEAGQEELRGGQAKLEAGQEELRGGQAKLEAGQANLEAGQEELRADQADLRAGFGRMEKRQDTMEEDIRVLKTDMAEVRGQLVPLAARRMVGRIADVTQSRRPRWLDNTDIIDISDDADTTDVPPNELESFRAIDLALRAVDKNSAGKQQQYVIIECSGTITRNDIARIARNAEYMTRFTGLPTKAVVIGYTLPDVVAEAARERSVHCLIVTSRSTRPR